MAKKENNKVQIKSVLGSTIMHNGITISPNEIIEIDHAIADVLLKKKFCVEVKVKEI